jgi:hypothetical protein
VAGGFPGGVRPKVKRWEVKEGLKHTMYMNIIKKKLSSYLTGNGHCDKSLKVAVSIPDEVIGFLS